MPSSPELNAIQIVLKTASALATLFPGVSIAAVPLSALADHEPEIADAIAGFSNVKHITLGDLINCEAAGIMSADVMKDTG